MMLASGSGSRRQEILRAALPVFLEHGLAGTSIEEIRRRSGASVGSIYHWFSGGKEAIAAALYVETLAAYQQRFLQTLAGEADARAGIEAVVRMHLDWVQSHPELARFLLTDSDVRPAARVELRRANSDFFGAVVGWLGDHRITGVPIGLLSVLWLGPSQELARHWLTGESATPPTTYADVLARAAWAAVDGLSTEA